MRDVEGYLRARVDEASSKPEDSEMLALWRRLRDVHGKRLWHQLTGILDDLVARQEMKEGSRLVDLYENVIADFEGKLQPLRLVRLIIPVVDSIQDVEEATTFLSGVGERVVKKDKEAFAHLRIVQASNVYLRPGLEVTELHMKQVKEIIEETEAILDDVDRVGHVHKEFYRLTSRFYQLKGDHGAYYQSCLRFLGCSELSDQSPEENSSLAFHLSLAALLAKEVFNFGELLAHPVVEHLPKDATWLLELLKAFNAGDVAAFKRLNPQWKQQKDLAEAEDLLYEKVRLLALLNLAFECPATRRQLSFGQISARTELPEGDVEFLVMKAFSRGLIRGQIDEASGRLVHVSWVQPRVLDRSQLDTLIRKVDEWKASIKIMEKLIVDNASDILTT